MTRDANIKPIEDEIKPTKETFQWKNPSEHVLFFLLYLTNYGTSILTTEFSLLPFLIVTIVFGYPILFFQNFVGQYTRRGCLFLADMLPIFAGLGYTMFLKSGFEFLNQIFNTSMLLFYLMVSIFNSSPPWMKCYSNYYEKFPNCFSKNDIDLCPLEKFDEPCFSPEKGVLSTYIFKEVVAFGRLHEKNLTSEIFFSKGMSRRSFNVISILLVWVPLISSAHISMKAIFSSVRITMSCNLAVLLTICILIMTAPGTTRGFIWVYKSIKFTDLFSIEVWNTYFKKVIEKLKLAEGFYILFGSFIPQNKPDPWRSLHLIGAFITVTIVSSLYCNLIMEGLNYRLHDDLRVYRNSEENLIFVIIPTFLGIQASSYFSSVMYYLLLCAISFHALVVKLIVLEKTITVQLNIPEYSYYGKVGICLLALVLALLIALPEENKILYDIEKLFQHYTPIAIGLLMLIIWIYGLQKLCDDVEYILKSKPKGLNKVGWILTPFVCSIYFFLNVYKYFIMNAVTVIFIIIISGIFAIGFFCKTFSLAKNRSLLDMLKSTNDYGPPDIGIRIQRILYNPSLIVKYKRGTEVCAHDCLLNHKVINTALNEELDLINNLITELKAEKTEDVDGKTISHMEKCRDYLVLMIKEQQKKETVDI